METTAVVVIEHAEGMQIETVHITAGGTVVRRAYPWPVIRVGDSAWWTVS